MLPICLFAAIHEPESASPSEPSQGRDFRLTDVAGNVVQKLLA
jgi:hypothetical protein